MLTIITWPIFVIKCLFIDNFLNNKILGDGKQPCTRCKVNNQECSFEQSEKKRGPVVGKYNIEHNAAYYLNKPKKIWEIAPSRVDPQIIF